MRSTLTTTKLNIPKSKAMGKIEIIYDSDCAYGYPKGTILTIEQLFEDYRASDDCDESLYDYLCRIPIPCAVDEIATDWGFDYKFV